MTTALLLTGGVAVLVLIVWLLRIAVLITKPAHDANDAGVDTVASRTDHILAIGGVSSIDDGHQPWDATKLEAGS